MWSNLGAAAILRFICLRGGGAVGGEEWVTASLRQMKMWLFIKPPVHLVLPSLKALNGPLSSFPSSAHWFHFAMLTKFRAAAFWEESHECLKSKSDYTSLFSLPWYVMLFTVMTLCQGQLVHSFSSAARCKTSLSDSSGGFYIKHKHMILYITFILNLYSSAVHSVISCKSTADNIHNKPLQHPSG